MNGLIFLKKQTDILKYEKLEMFLIIGIAAFKMP